jgi:hypothetical protein
MTAQWRRIASSAAVLLALVSVGAATATPADAKPKKPGLDQYANCIRTQLNSINQDWSKIPNDAVRAALENCCTNLGGIFNENTKECYLPNGDTAKPPTSPPVPPPGATAVLPPGGGSVRQLQ